MTGLLKTREVGKRAEDLACEYLVQKGFKIIEKNCILSIGEIDIITREKLRISNIFRQRPIHFIEVKALATKSDFFFPEEKFDLRKQNKYRRLIEIWLHKNRYPLDYPCQVDILAISFQKRKSPEIFYFENVISSNFS